MVMSMSVDVGVDVDVDVDVDMRWNGRIYMIDLKRARRHAFYAWALRLVKRGVCWLPAEGILWVSFHGRWEPVRDWWEALMSSSLAIESHSSRVCSCKPSQDDWKGLD